MTISARRIAVIRQCRDGRVYVRSDGKNAALLSNLEDDGYLARVADDKIGSFRWVPSKAGLRALRDVGTAVAISDARLPVRSRSDLTCSRTCALCNLGWTLANGAVLCRCVQEVDAIAESQAEVR